MKNGKISESVLKRSVLKQLHTKSDRILFKPAVGEDCAVISMQAGGQTKLVTATQTFTLDVSDKHVRANCAVYDALNNIYAMGASPVGIELALLVPTTENEAVLRETVRAIDAVCEEAGIVVLGGHTQVSRAVKNIVVTVTAIGEAYEQALTPSSAAAPGMDVIVTGYVGLEGTAILANEKRAELETRFSKAFIANSSIKVENVRVSNVDKQLTLSMTLNLDKLQMPTNNQFVLTEDEPALVLDVKTNSRSLCHIPECSKDASLRSVMDCRHTGANRGCSLHCGGNMVYICC